MISMCLSVILIFRTSWLTWGWRKHTRKIKISGPSLTFIDITHLIDMLAAQFDHVQRGEGPAVAGPLRQGPVHRRGDQHHAGLVCPLKYNILYLYVIFTLTK